jgi:hypothetical protein
VQAALRASKGCFLRHPISVQLEGRPLHLEQLKGASVVTFGFEMGSGQKRTLMIAMQSLTRPKRIKNSKNSCFFFNLKFPHIA